MTSSNKRKKLPRELRFSTPGLISNEFYASDLKKFTVRNTFMPENFFVSLENKFIYLNGSKGKTLLYHIGKQFGYRFALLHRFPKGNMNNVAITSINQFFEIVYASKITTKMLDSNNKVLDTYFKDFAVTNKNGSGYSLTIGGWCGIWAYLSNDYSIETFSSQISRDTYSLLTAPRKLLRERGLDIIECDVLPTPVDFRLYIQNNQPQLISAESATSFKKLFEAGFVVYRPGKILMKTSGERIIPVEISLLFELESKIDAKIIYDSSYQPFHDIGLSFRKKIEPKKFAEDLLTGFGLGLVRIRELNDVLEIKFSGYPWFSKETENTSFAYIKGAVVGLLDGGSNSEHFVDKLHAEMEDNSFNLTLTIKKK